MTIGVWNAEWAKIRTESGSALKDLLESWAFDLICLTEAYPELLPSPGHLLASDPDYGYPLHPGRRKVILCSPHPWRMTDPLGLPDLPPGRFISGVTATPIGDIRVIGVCIPWKDAHVRSGRRDRKPWEDHLHYLKGLAAYLQQLPTGIPTIIAGDFNQRIPRTCVPQPVADALSHALSGYRVATAGIVPPLERPLIDHLAHCSCLAPTRTSAWPGTRADGLYLSDHDGVGVSLERTSDPRPLQSTPLPLP